MNAITRREFLASTGKGMVGAAVALGFPFGIFGGFLEGLQRFYILNWTNIVANLLRAGLIFFSLKHGGGILAVALITVTLTVFVAAANGLLRYRQLLRDEIAHTVAEPGEVDEELQHLFAVLAG